MQYEQVKPFNPAQGGTTPNMCLANVTAGFGIPNKYGSAWEAWQHTQQHADRNVPAGLAVPLYYSYTATIDGVTENYGHINVQLPNGTVWSDGNIYTSIDAYLANHFPKYVGWGESINDATIIKGSEEPMVNEGDIINMAALGGWKPPQNYIDYWNGKDWKSFMYDLTGQTEFLQNLAQKYGSSAAQAKLDQIKQIVG